jgi:hypothetical protein
MEGGRPDPLWVDWPDSADGLRYRERNALRWSRRIHRMTQQ